jgi:dihydroorotate dehydrogenase
MKSVAAAIIIALATVHSFTPNPTFGSRRASLVDTQFSSFSTQLYGFKSSKSSQYLDSLDQEQMMAEQMNDVTSPLAMDSVEEEEEMTESQKLLKKVKESGTAGIISYALWELGFWALSVPVCIFGYREVTG